MRFRGKSVRRAIAALLLVPLVSLIAIWAFAATITSRGAVSLFAVQKMTDKIGYPVDNLVQALAAERRSAMVYLADPHRAGARDDLRAAEGTTDRALTALRANTADPDVTGNLDAASRQRLDAAVGRAGVLRSLRQRLDDGALDLDAAFTAYNAEIDPYFAFFLGLTPLQNAGLDRQTSVLIEMSRAHESIAREDALYTAAQVAGSMSRADQRAFSDAVAQQRMIHQTYAQLLPDGDRRLYDGFWDGPAGRRLGAAEERIITADASRPATDAVPSAEWRSTASTALRELDAVNRRATTDYEQRVAPFARDVLLQAALAGGFGLLAVLVSLGVSLRIGRRVARDLTALRREALEVSGTRLPSVMRRLAAGEQVDVETEVPRLEYSDDEIGQVGRALNALQRAAVEAAVRQADMRRGISDVFVNLARRSQVLLHRQLTLLDTMERRTDSAEELADLFRLDHMTTRMRRHAEGLVILSGSAPSRQWRKPVRLMDVVRAAVAEVEDYERVEVRRLPRLSIAGSAVGDVTHLLAELIENATVFSPPHTTVRVHGERAANGFVLEIDDRGLGMTPDALLDANLRLAETPEFELSDTDRLGLFVVSRLAQRQGVRVSLLSSPYGGITAVVLLPNALLIDGDDSSTTGTQALPAALGRPAAPRRELTAGSGASDAADRTRHAFREWGLLPGDAVEEPPSEPAVLRAHFEGTDRSEQPDQHQQAPDSVRPAEPAEQPDGVLPRRRTTPVLVADRGRTVAADSVPRFRAGTGDDREPSASEPAGSSESAQSSQPSGSEPAGPPERPAPTTSTGLPRRIRQASLVPQLRDGGQQPAPARQTPAPAPQPPHERDADEVRSRMAALQRGWERGRAEADDLVAPDAPDDRSGTTTRTTSEGDGP